MPRNLFLLFGIEESKRTPEYDGPTQIVIKADLDEAESLENAGNVNSEGEGLAPMEIIITEYLDSESDNDAPPANKKPKKDGDANNVMDLSSLRSSHRAELSKSKRYDDDATFVPKPSTSKCDDTVYTTKRDNKRLEGKSTDKNDSSIAANFVSKPSTSKCIDNGMEPTANKKSEKLKEDAVDINDLHLAVNLASTYSSSECNRSISSTKFAPKTLKKDNIGSNNLPFATNSTPKPSTSKCDDNVTYKESVNLKKDITNRHDLPHTANFEPKPSTSKCDDMPITDQEPNKLNDAIMDNLLPTISNHDNENSDEIEENVTEHKEKTEPEVVMVSRSTNTSPLGVRLSTLKETEQQKYERGIRNFAYSLAPVLDVLEADDKFDIEIGILGVLKECLSAEDEPKMDDLSI